MDGKHYWQIKAIELEGVVLRRGLETEWTRYQAKRRAVYEAAGLDAAVAYQMDDAAETMTPATQEGDHAATA
jgi:hypothetical protein